MKTNLIASILYGAVIGFLIAALPGSGLILTCIAFFGTTIVSYLFLEVVFPEFK